MQIVALGDKRQFVWNGKAFFSGEKSSVYRLLYLFRG